jgi:uncharacterized protein (TIGR03790 family)
MMSSILDTVCFFSTGRTAVALLATALFCVLTAGPSAACAGEPRTRTADEVLLVYNQNSRISKAVAEDYAHRRHVKNVVGVTCPDSASDADNETIPLDAFILSIERPIRAHLAAHSSINFIVLTKGVPIRIIGAGIGSCDENSREPRATRGHPSVDSYLAALDYAKLPGVRVLEIAGSGAIGRAYANRYWNASEPFSHAKFGGYLVTRLDGYTEADARALTTRALNAERAMVRGTVLLDVQPTFGLGDKATQPGPIAGNVIKQESDFSEYNADLRHAHDVLAGRGMLDELDLSEDFVGNRKDLLGYFSWGSNDAKFSNAAYQPMRFAPGSISDTAVSTSGRTFLPTEGGQSLLADLIAHGLTCGKGYVDEPLLQAIASPTIALDRYTAGYTMAESLYAASHFVGWEDVVIGDALCCPFAHARSGAPQGR